MNKRTILWVCIYAIAMGFFESAVVIYLRELFYKTGFAFPLKPIPAQLARIEFVRELATLIMLVSCGIVAGKTKLERFAYFVLAFALWDLFYYIFLYVCIGWPQSLSTWDILFLIPVPWVGPVWAPCLLCLLMIGGSAYIIYRINTRPGYQIQIFHWCMLISGAIICIFSFMWDYIRFTSESSNSWSFLSTKALFSEITSYVPEQFNYGFFFCGFFLMCLPFILFIIKPSKK
jgi:hypothetical protein